jgi:hypothetical protein
MARPIATRWRWPRDSAEGLRKKRIEAEEERDENVMMASETNDAAAAMPMRQKVKDSR